jgi:hypothetical protein
MSTIWNKEKRKMKRIHRIGNSKEPTVSQLIKMAENLRSVYEVFSHVSANGKAYGRIKQAYARFQIYVEDKTYATEQYDTWPELLTRYRELMKGAKDGSA